MTLLDRAREIATGKPAHPDMPVQIQPEELTPADPPEIRGSRYYVHKRWGLLRPRAELEPETIDWPPLPFVEERNTDGIRFARLYEMVDAATWERLTKPRPVRATDQAPRHPVDALAGLWTFRAVPDVFLPGAARGVDTMDVTSLQYVVEHRGESDHRRVQGKPRASTPAEWIERFERKEISLSLAPDGRLVARAVKGRINDSEREALHRSSRLIAAYLSGKPLVCAWCTAQAVTLLEPDSVEACPEHSL